MDCEQEEGRGEIGKSVHHAEVKYLQIQEELAAVLLLMVLQLFLDLLKREIAAVDPSFSLA